jgi:hypothetical protein
VEATAQLIPKLRERGYRFKTVSQLLDLQACDQTCRNCIERPANAN